MSLKTVKSYLDLCRVSNLPTVWTNVLAGVVLSGIPFSLHHFITLSLSLSFFYSGGMCLNDIFDAKTDTGKKPFRPIPSQRISINSAVLFTIALFTIAILLLVFVPHREAIYAGLLLLILILIYDKFHKGHPLSVILMAACRAMVFVVSSIAVAGTVGKFVAIAGALQFIYVLVISIVARYENKGGMRGYSFPVVPVMLACISLLDGIVMAVLISPVWLTAGITGTTLTLLGQRYVRGD
ncbi:MAG: UbiA family prenyltransferase [Nitrospirae bacterium]|nr:UbiA family prenyltransferase [Nitrospirota bacterium]